MFTVKFMKFFEDGQTENCIRCPHYGARKLANGDYIISVYSDMTICDGVDWRVTKDHPDDAPVSFDVCFVENEDGKTIAKYVVHHPKK